MWLDKKYGLGHTARDVSMATLLPLTKIVDWPGQVSDFAQSKFQTGDMLEENKKLKKQVATLKRKIQKLNLQNQEIVKYKKLLAASRELRETVRATRIYKVNVNRHKQYVEINMGRRDCVYEDQALIDGYGVMGQVIQVHWNTAIVRLITDQNHIIPVQFKKSGIRAMAYGTGKEWLLKLPHLSTSQDVEAGEEIISSGLGQMYPYGYSVGKVIDVKISPGAKYKIARVKPSAQLDRTRDALLVWSEDVVNQKKEVKKCMEKFKRESSKDAAKK